MMPDLNAQMAYEHWARRDLKEARPFADKALELKPHHPLASYVKAQLLVTIGDEDAALEILEPALDPKHPNEQVIDLLGELMMKAGRLDEAEKALRARPQGRPVSHQVDLVAGADSPAPEEDSRVPDRPGHDRVVRRRQHRRSPGTGRAVPGRGRRRLGREVGRRLPAHQRLRSRDPRPAGRCPDDGEEISSRPPRVPDGARS